MENFICPLSLMVFRNPVIMDDGITYEHELIEKMVR